MEIRWVKIFTWRANGDGIGLKKNTLVFKDFEGLNIVVFSFSLLYVTQLEDSFIRTQDDSMYVQGRGVRRVVFWNDVNGVPFLLTKVGESSMEDHDIVVEDCTVGALPCFTTVKATSPDQLNHFVRWCILEGGSHPALGGRCIKLTALRWCLKSYKLYMLLFIFLLHTFLLWCTPAPLLIAHSDSVSDRHSTCEVEAEVRVELDSHSGFLPSQLASLLHM